MKPQRIQLSRKKGFKLQWASIALNGLPAINVARPSKWGNPFKIGSRFLDYSQDRIPLIQCGTREQSIASFKAWLDFFPSKKRAIRKELRGKNLACWCKLLDPCHADILLKLANETKP